MATLKKQTGIAGERPPDASLDELRTDVEGLQQRIRQLEAEAGDWRARLEWVEAQMAELRQELEQRFGLALKINS